MGLGKHVPPLPHAERDPHGNDACVRKVLTCHQKYMGKKNTQTSIFLAAKLRIKVILTGRPLPQRTHGEPLSNVEGIKKNLLKKKGSQLAVMKLLPDGLKASGENTGIRLITNKPGSQSPALPHICLVRLLVSSQMC